MDGIKYMVLGFSSHDDFEICNKLMKVQIGDVGISADGLFVVMVKTESILVPHGVLTVKTARDREIHIKVTSGITKKITDVTFDSEGNIEPQ